MIYFAYLFGNLSIFLYPLQVLEMMKLSSNDKRYPIVNYISKKNFKERTFKSLLSILKFIFLNYVLKIFLKWLKKFF